MKKTIEIDVTAGPGIELWDDDGPMTDRICIPIMLVRADATRLLYYAGPHRRGKVLRKGFATTGVWYPDRDSGVPFIRVDYPNPVPLDEGTWSVRGPLFGSAYTELRGVGVHT